MAVLIGRPIVESLGEYLESPEEGKWYVSGQIPEYDDMGYRPFRYLHRDGIWRASTASEGGFTGYFMTEADAEAALNSTIFDVVE